MVSFNEAVGELGFREEGGAHFGSQAPVDHVGQPVHFQVLEQVDQLPIAHPLGALLAAKLLDDFGERDRVLAFDEVKDGGVLLGLADRAVDVVGDHGADAVRESDFLPADPLGLRAYLLGVGSDDLSEGQFQGVLVLPLQVGVGHFQPLLNILAALFGFALVVGVLQNSGVVFESVVPLEVADEPFLDDLDERVFIFLPAVFDLVVLDLVEKSVQGVVYLILAQDVFYVLVGGLALVKNLEGSLEGLLYHLKQLADVHELQLHLALLEQEHHLLDAEDEAAGSLRVGNGEGLEVGDEFEGAGGEVGHDPGVADAAVEELAEELAVLVEGDGDEFDFGADVVVAEFEVVVGGEDEHAVAVGEPLLEDVGVGGRQVGDGGVAVDHEVVVDLDALVLLVQPQRDRADLIELPLHHVHLAAVLEEPAQAAAGVAHDLLIFLLDLPQLRNHLHQFRHELFQVLLLVLLQGDRDYQLPLVALPCLFLLVEVVLDEHDELL